MAGLYYPKILLCHCSKNVLRVLLQCTLNFPALTVQVKTGIIPTVNDNKGVVPLWHRMGEPTSVFEGACIAFPVQESSVVEEAGKGAESTHLLWVGSQRSHREAIFSPCSLFGTGKFRYLECRWDTKPQMVHASESARTKGTAVEILDQVRSGETGVGRVNWTIT